MAYSIRTTHQKGKHESKLIQHLGIISGICNENRLAELIDQRIEQKRRKVYVEQAVQTMILNALGFSGRALYLTLQFYSGRPVDLLIGKGVQAQDLHDSSLGTALDALFDYGVTELFYSVAKEILERNGISTRFSIWILPPSASMGHTTAMRMPVILRNEVVQITKGLSKDNEPGLNQVVLQLICANRSSIPL